MARTQHSASDYMDDAEEGSRGRVGSGRGVTTGSKGKRAAAAMRGDSKSNLELTRPDKTGVGRRQGLDTRDKDPMFAAAMRAIDAMQRRRRKS